MVLYVQLTWLGRLALALLALPIGAIVPWTFLGSHSTQLTMDPPATKLIIKPTAKAHQSQPLPNKEVSHNPQCLPRHKSIGAIPPPPLGPQSLAISSWPSCPDIPHFSNSPGLIVQDSRPSAKAPQLRFLVPQAMPTSSSALNHFVYELDRSAPVQVLHIQALAFGLPIVRLL